MINAIIEAVSLALGSEFGDGCEFHTEEIRQGLEKPCFFISCLSPAVKLFQGRRYFRTNPICVRYFPVTSEKQHECNETAERMWQCLEYIRIAGDDRLLRGTEMKYEITDGVLKFFVNYDCFVYKTQQQAPMEGMETSISVKEGG